MPAVSLAAKLSLNSKPLTMKIKILKIRLSEDNQKNDEKLLTSYLRKFDVLQCVSHLVQAEEPYWSVMLHFEEKNATVSERTSAKYSAPSEEMNSDEVKLLEALKNWRSEKSREEKLPSYFIATNSELLSIAKFKPAKKEELIEIKGFGKHKIENYGAEIIGILESV